MSNANLQHFLKDGPMDKPQWYANAFHRSKVMIEMEVESLSNEAKACKERFARYEKLMVNVNLISFVFMQYCPAQKFKSFGNKADLNF